VKSVQADHSGTDDDAIYTFHFLVPVSAWLVKSVQAGHSGTDDDAIYSFHRFPKKRLQNDSASACTDDKSVRADCRLHADDEAIRM
jgi:hypothetical protein